MIIEFNEVDHVYTINGDIASISVTELLRKHGLAPSYSGVNKEVLRRASAFGKAIHLDLENVLNVAKYEPTTWQGEEFKAWVDKNLECGAGEQMFGMNYNGLTICGTADFVGINKEGAFVIGDHKTTSTLHKEYVAWQVSILDYIARKMSGQMVNGIKFNWSGAKQFYVLHYKYDKAKDKKFFKKHLLEKKSDTDIEALLNAELNGKKYEPQSLSVAKDFEAKVIKAEQYLIATQRAFEEAKNEAQKVRQELLKMFGEQRVYSWESRDGNVKVTRIPESERVVVDSARLKKEMPQVYSKYAKISKTSEYLKITIRGE